VDEFAELRSVPENHYNARFDRIEKKLDNVVETISALARVEERQYAQNKRMDRFEYRLDINETDLDNLKHSFGATAVSSRIVERVLWLVFAACITAASHFLTN